MNYREIVHASKAPNAIANIVTKNVLPLKLSGDVMSQYRQVFSNACVDYSATRRMVGENLWDQYRFETVVIGLVNIASNQAKVNELNDDPDKSVHKLPETIRERNKEEWLRRKAMYINQEVFPYTVATSYDRIDWARNFLEWFTKYIAPINSVVEVGSGADALLLGMKESKKVALHQLVGIDKLSVAEAIDTDSMRVLTQSLLEKRKLSKELYLEELADNHIEHHVASIFDLETVAGKIKSVSPRLLMFNHILEYFPKVSIKSAIEQAVEYLRPNYIVIRNGLATHGIRDKVNPNGIYFHKIKY